MPRQSRIDAPGALHHVIIRGIERKPIFKDDADRGGFLERLDRILTETSTPCYAWALMTNHVHLLIRTMAAPLAMVMRRLLTGYAMAFNRRHRRHGQLFQNRYKSILCQEDVYLLELTRYIQVISFSRRSIWVVSINHGNTGWNPRESIWIMWPGKWLIISKYPPTGCLPPVDIPRW